MPFEPTPEQAKAIRTLASPLTIGAGAGSGKTRVLAERFAAAVDPTAPVPGWEPAGIDEALTVTFTEKAAGEIAERVRRVLLEHGLVGEARRVDEAWISTIHGLCTRLLRTHAIEAGIDPQFAVITAVDAGVLREEVFEALLAEELASGRATLLVARYGVGGVQDHVAAVHDRLRAMGASVNDITTDDPADPIAVLTAARTAVASWTATLAAHPAPGANLVKNLERLSAAAEELAALAHDTHAPEEAARGTLAALHGLRLLKSVGGAKELVLEALEERAGLIEQAVRAVAVPLELELVRLTGAFAGRYDAAKAERGALDFEDLQLRAVALLRDNPRLAARYREAFRLVMIDEFQDTNEVQTALADLLADGTLCTVGDERQSIYGFRYADVDVYRRHREAMVAAGAEQAHLDANFRSHGDVLDFANAVFTSPRLFGEGFRPLVHGRDEAAAEPLLPAGEPRVELVTVSRGGRTAAPARSVEADAVARRLRELAEAGVPQGSMVVLLRAMTHAEEYTAALGRHGLDYTIAAGGSFFGRPEVEALRALLRAATNPLDDEALAHVLASGVGGVSDDGLMRLRMAAERAPLWEAVDAAGLTGTDAEAAARVRATLSAARARLGRVPVAEIIHRACEESDYDLTLLAQGSDGRHAYANVLKLARLAEEFESAGQGGVRHFLEHLELKERFRDREAPASVIDERADAVRVMTVHSAKGLEFPVVAVPELGRDLSGDRDALVLEKTGAGARIALTLPDDGSGSKAEERRSAWEAAARARARERDIEEEKRLLYVACTRAREYLLLSGTGDLAKGCGESPLGWLLEALDGASDLRPRRAELSEDDEPAECAPAPAAHPPAPVRSVVAATPGVAEPAPAPAAPGTPPEVSYTAIAGFESCGLRFFAERIAKVGTIAEAQGGPLGFGDAVHAVLRLAGPDARPPADERIDAIAKAHRLDADMHDRLRAAVEAFARSTACSDAAALGEGAHEVPFAVRLDSVTLAGKLDLLVRAGERALVVDYKTGEGACALDAAERYRTQADCYALACLAGGAAETEVAFVGLETDDGAGLPREVRFTYTGADAAALREGIGERARRLAEGPYEPLTAYKPGTCDDCPIARGVCPVRVPGRT